MSNNRKIGDVEVYEQNGLIFARSSSMSRSLLSGTNPQLSAAPNLNVWWLSNRVLNRATLDPQTLTLGASAQFTTNVDGFAVKDLSNNGTAVAAISGSSMKVFVGSITYNVAWPAERSFDFDFDFSVDLQTMYTFYRKPGSPMQAFVEEYIQQAADQLEIFKVYDFSLGPQDLPDVLVRFFT